MKKPKSLSANISNLLNSLPQGFDEEDEIDDTSAKVLTAYSDDSDQEEVIERSKIRAKNIDLLEDIDKKYAGKVSNRKKYRDFDSDDELHEEAGKEENSGDEGTAELDENESDVGSDEDEVDVESDEDEVDKESDGEEIDEDNSDNENEEESEIEDGNEASLESDDENFKNFTGSDSKGECNKGLCVRKQLSIWESLLEIRIKSKKALSASNKLPTGEKFKKIISNADEESKQKLIHTKKNVNNLLDKMITLQTLLLNKYPETKKLLSKKRRNSDNDSDEEISSDEESDNEQDNKRIKIQNYEKDLSERHEVYKIYRNKTIEKWYDKTRIKHTQSNAHTIVDQINHILLDKSKLLKKTQLKRSNYQIIGEEENENECDVNIYDDEDFYHQQLKELVEFKSSDIMDPLQLGRQWVQLQNMRSKMKRKIDTRATKGRKLRFGVHTKLVNHIACRDYEDSKTEDARKELINSIFQKK